MDRGVVAILGLALVFAGLGVAQAASASQQDHTVHVPQLGPGDGLRVREVFSVQDTRVTSERIVVAEEPEAVRDGRGQLEVGLPIVAYRRSTGPVDEATRCTADADDARALQRIRLREDFYDPPLEHAWELDPRSPDAVFDPVERRLPGSTAAYVTFVGHACPGRTPLTGTSYSAAAPPSAESLIPAQIPLDSGTLVSTEQQTDPTRTHGRDALWVNTTFTAALPGFAASEARPVRPGPVTVDGSVHALIADGLPEPVRTKVILDLEVGDDTGPFDRRVAWETILTGYRDADRPNLPSDHEPDRIDRRPADLEDGPTTEAFDFEYPLSEAVRTIEDGTSLRFQLFEREHPHAYLTEATYHPRTTAAEMAADRAWIPAPRAAQGPGWTLTFEADDATYKAATVRETTSRDEVGFGGDNRTSTTDLAWDHSDRVQDPDDPDGPGTAIPDHRLPGRTAPPSAVREALEAHRFPFNRIDRFQYSVGAAEPGADPLATYAFSVELPASANDEAIPQLALADAETGRLLALSTAPGIHEGTNELLDRLPMPEPLDQERSERQEDHQAQLPGGPTAGIGTAAGAALALLALLAKFVLAPFFSRISREEVLENPVRDELMDRIREDPGVHLAGLIKEGGVGNGATRHHLRKLEEANLVERVEIQGYVRFFPAGELTDAEVRKQAVLKAGSNAQVYDAFRRDPGASIREIARRLDMSPSSVHRAVSQLREADLL